MKLELVAISLMGGMLASCHAVVSCDASAVPAIKLAIHDEQTSGTLVGESTVIWTDPAGTVDTIAVVLDAGANPINVGLRPGEYKILVRHTGYAEWQGVVPVAADGCKPQTATVTASLKRTGIALLFPDPAKPTA